MLTRREFVVASGLACAGIMGASCTNAGLSFHGHSINTWRQLIPEFAKIEKEAGGRLGIAVHEGSYNLSLGYHCQDRFPMCSTFKLLLSAAVLKQVDEGKETLERRINYAASDLVTYSPVTEKHAGTDGMTVAELCEATMTLSDNTAANLLLREVVSGPKGMTSFCRNIGDRVTRLDRIEPELNEATPGDPRDTTTPSAMAKNIWRLVFGHALAESSQSLLIKWLRNNKTGDARIRAGLPTDWVVGEKTGTGGRGSTNDAGIIFPPHRPPLAVSVYLTETDRPIEQREAAIASVARLIAKAFVA